MKKRAARTQSDTTAAQVAAGVALNAKRPAHESPAPAAQTEPKGKGGARVGNQHRTTHGQYRATKGPKRRTPVNADAHDDTGKLRAREVYRGCGHEWAAERRSYAEDYAAELRIEAKGKLRGFFTSSGDAKDLLRIFLDLKKRRGEREKEVREHRLATHGGADTPVSALHFVMPGRPGIPPNETCHACGAELLPLGEIDLATTGIYVAEGNHRMHPPGGHPITARAIEMLSPAAPAPAPRHVAPTVANVPMVSPAHDAPQQPADATSTPLPADGGIPRKDSAPAIEPELDEREVKAVELALEQMRNRPSPNYRDDKKARGWS